MYQNCFGKSNIRSLNAYVARVKRTIELNNVFANAKCRRLENSTRWGINIPYALIAWSFNSKLLCSYLIAELAKHESAALIKPLIFE